MNSGAFTFDVKQAVKGFRRRVRDAATLRVPGSIYQYIKPPKALDRLGHGARRRPCLTQVARIDFSALADLLLHRSQLFRIAVNQQHAGKSFAQEFARHRRTNALRTACDQSRSHFYLMTKGSAIGCIRCIDPD